MSLGSTLPTDAGTYTVIASFAGNADYASVQSSPETFTIGRARATITLTSSGGSAVFGQSVSYVATVKAVGTPEGAITFFDGAVPLATVPVNGSGLATLAITNLPPGSHRITASYSGDADILVLIVGDSTLGSPGRDPGRPGAKSDLQKEESGVGHVERGGRTDRSRRRLADR